MITHKRWIIGQRNVIGLLWINSVTDRGGKRQDNQHVGGRNAVSTYITRFYDDSRSFPLTFFSHGVLAPG